MNPSPEHYRLAFSAIQLSKFRILSQLDTKNSIEKVLDHAQDLYLQRFKCVKFEEMQSVANLIEGMLNLHYAPKGRLQITDKLRLLGVMLLDGTASYLSQRDWLVRGDASTRCVYINGCLIGKNEWGYAGGGPQRTARVIIDHVGGPACFALSQRYYHDVISLIPHYNDWGITGGQVLDWLSSQEGRPA